MKPTNEQIEQYRVVIRGADICGKYEDFPQKRQIIALHDENVKLREALENVVEMEKANTGAEPSVSCFYRAIEEARELLK